MNLEDFLFIRGMPFSGSHERELSLIREEVKEAFKMKALPRINMASTRDGLRRDGMAAEMPSAVKSTVAA